MATTRPRLVVRVAALLLAATTVSACQSDPRSAADPAPAAAPSSSAARPAPVATARALAAIAIDAGLPGRVRSASGDSDGRGAIAWVRFTGGRGARSLYLTSVVGGDPERVPGSCEAPAHVEVVWCEERDREVRLILVVGGPGSRLVTGEVRTQATTVSVVATDVGTVTEATAYLRRLLADDRLGFRTTAAAIAAGEELAVFEDGELTWEVNTGGRIAG